MRTPTTWSPNSNKSQGVLYSSPTVTYSSSTTAYSSPDALLGDFGAIATDWNKTAKTPTVWAINTSSQDSDSSYDAATAYDSSTSNYDALVSSQSPETIAIPTIWSPS